MDKEASRESIRLGHAARRAKRSGDALDHYRAALAAEPDNAEANSACGLMLLHLGRADDAEPLLRKAVEIAPTHAAFRMNLAQLFTHQAKLDEAVQMVQGVAADEPQFWWPWDRLGDLKVRLQRFGDAALHFGHAAELRPGDPSILYKWARSCFDDGHVADAEQILIKAAKLAPTHEAILWLHAEILESQAKWAALEQQAKSWTEAHPKSARAWRALATAQSEAGYLRQAMQSFRTSLELGWRDARSLATFGRLCLSALDFDSATLAFAEAEALDPNDSHMLSGKAVQLMFSGRYDEARSYCRRSLGANSDDAAAYKLLSQLMNGRLPEEDFAALKLLTDRQDIRIKDRMSAVFALADCLDARGEIDQAFVAYERANRLAGECAEIEGILYDRVARTQQTDELISIFGSVPIGIAGASDRRAIFIVGMPRSGTTLIESVIGAHSRVFACGELMAMRWILEEFLSLARSPASANISESTWEQWRDFYWREIPDSRGATVVTDKNPWNFDAIGLILRLFPDARIIHVRRNPVETGYSIFRNQFSKFMPFTNRLEDIGHYHGEYARLMAHWDHVAGDRFTTIQYEDFIERFDVAGPALLTTCGLDWEESCRNYWSSGRVIGTMSTMQARQPPGKLAGRAQSYAAHLLPLVESLNAAGVELKTGALRPGQE